MSLVSKTDEPVGNQPPNQEKIIRRAQGRPGAGAPAGESAALRTVGAVSQLVFGDVKAQGYSIEWHDFYAAREFEWGGGSRAAGVELCLNLDGNGYMDGSGTRQEFARETAGFYRRLDSALTGRRRAAQHHQFLTVQFSDAFLTRHLAGTESQLHPVVRAAMENKPGPAGPSSATRLTADHQQMVVALRRPPVYAAAQPTWYQCKTLELAVTFFFQPPPEEEFFCTRQHRLARERVEQVVFLLKQKLAEPFSLEELGRKIGCSPSYLSRTFSSQTGQTISQYLRRLRMDMAAELLRQGELNVTEVALEVGYASPSHFSQTFHETFGCCPGLYPIRTVAGLSAGAKAGKTLGC